MTTVIHESSTRKKTYKCPYCDYRGTKEKLISHIELKHEDMIPEGYSPSRIVFNLINKKETGYCIICKKETAWNEDKCRYERLCNDPNCRKEYKRMTEERIKKIYGKTSRELLLDPNQQTKMLSNRRISGSYKWSDGSHKTYTGDYERKTLEFLDKTMGYDSADVETPGPIVEYMYNGIHHIWITDIYIAPYKLAIDCKDGGDNPNNRPMKEYREKQIAKEKAIASAGEYNYLRLTNNNFKQLIEVLSLLKLQFVEDNVDERIIRINEMMSIAGFMPPANINNTYIVNYGMNNVFNIGIAKDLKLDNLIIIDDDGILKHVDESFLFNADYTIYKLNTPMSVEDAKYIKSHMNKRVDSSFLYESIFHKKLYTIDQILTEDVTEVQDLYDYYHTIEKIVESTLLGSEFSIKLDDYVYTDENGKYLKNSDTGIRTKSIIDGEHSDIEKMIILNGGI